MFFEKITKGTLVRIKLTPNASASKIEDLFEDEKGITWLKAKVTSTPEDGKANKALIQLLSKSWKIPKTKFSFIQGEFDRYKVLCINNADPHLLFLKE
jgi:uncharacterized protein (TIGR00251 family)